jgi:sigma-B regulation protein RsbU (phosphoserine phosphatase)
MDYTACVCFEHLSTEEKRLLEDDLEFSQKVQQSLLPRRIPDLPGLELAAFSQPARIVGGDYFDFFEYPDGSHGLAIADVVDKGVPASLLMASLQASLRILVPDSDSPAAVAERLNRMLSHNVQLTQFVTLFLARFDPRTRRLQYCNAGQNPPLLFHTDESGVASLTWLQPTGAAIGLIEQSQFKAETITLSPGDILLLYTDGLTDMRNPAGVEFRAEGLAKFIRQNSNLAAAELMQELRRSLQAFSAGRAIDDDTTVVVCRIVG